MSKDSTRQSNSRANQPLVPIEECGLACAAQLLGDRWVLLILREAFYGVTRFDAIREDVGASKHALSGRLAHLTDAGILALSPYREPGARERNEYVLTEKGAALAPVLLSLLDWGQSHLRSSSVRVSAVERSSGQEVRCRFVTADGRVVSSSELELRLCS